MNDKVIIDYCVIAKMELSTLEIVVRSYLVKGYQPFGNLFISNTFYHQPMIKYAQKEKEPIQWENS